MAVIRIDQFNGLIPRMHPTLLPEGCAITANNLRLKNGKLIPLREPSMVVSPDVYLENGLDDISNAKTIYPWKRKVNGQNVTTFLAWEGEVDVAQSNIYNDAYDRLVVSGDTGIPYVVGAVNNEPSVYYNNNGTITRRTLIKEALPAPVVHLNSGGNSDTNNTRYTNYFQSWVDKYGNESPLSAASDELEYNDGDSVNISAVTKPAQAVKRRVYKVVSGTATEAVQFVIEWDDTLAFGAKDFSVKDENAGEVIPNIVSPPSDLMGIHFVPGGYYCGFSKSEPKTVRFSEINMLYSWPTGYQYDVRDNIVGLAVTTNMVYALTDGRPWMLMGTAPESMVVSALTPAACVAKNSICTWKNNVYFAGNYGIMMIHTDPAAGTIVSNLTEKFFRKEQWDALNPSTCHMHLFDGCLYAFFDSKSYVFDLNEQTCALTTHDESASCACVDDETDSMYFVKLDEESV